MNEFRHGESVTPNVCDQRAAVVCNTAMPSKILSRSLAASSSPSPHSARTRSDTNSKYRSDADSHHCLVTCCRASTVATGCRRPAMCPTTVVSSDVSLLSDVKSPAIQVLNQILCMTTRRLLVSCSLTKIARRPRAARRKKEKGLLLHPPLRHEPA
jgi:hypothetical protein